MLNDEHNTPDTIHVAGSNHEDSSSSVELSTNTRARLENLARWRMDPALLKFPRDGPNIEGGYAIVSRALLISSSNETKGQLVAPSGGGVKSGGRIAKLEGDNRGQEAEEPRGEARKGDKAETEGEENEFDDEASGRRKAVAVKKMNINTPDEVVRVLGLTLREAEFLVRLSHENIIKLQGFAEDVSKKMIWLVFPWEDNGTLKDFVALHDWAVPERLSLIYDVTSGVQYIHSRDPPICHADLKSINILVNSQCRAVITDFGSAHYPATNDLNKKREGPMDELRTVPPVEAMFCTWTNTITLTGIHCTTRWAAPEVLERDEFTTASDIWALGWVAYEVMTNSIPFHNVKEPMVIHRVVRGDLPSISDDVRLLLIQELCSTVGQCWQLDPKKRPTAKDCHSSIYWMPKITPNLNPIQKKDVEGSVDRSAGLLMQLGELYRRQSDYVNAPKYFTKALEIFMKVSNRKGTADALYQLARIDRFQQEYGQAVLRYTEALGIYSELSNRRGRAIVIWSLADIHRVRGEYSQAITFYTEALQIFTDIGDWWGRADALAGLAEVHRLRNEHDQAVAFYSESLRIRTDIGDRRGRAEAFWGLAWVHRVRNEYDQAVAFYSESLQIQTDVGDRGGRADALSGLASVHRVRNEYDQAVTFYSECLQIRTDIGDRLGRADALLSLADVHRARNEDSQAVALYSECLQIQTDIGDKRGRADAFCGLADVHRARNEYSQAVAFYFESLQIRTDIGDRYGRAFGLQCMGDAKRDQHDHSSAIHNYEQAAEIYEKIGAPQQAIVMERAANLRRLIEQGTA